MTIQQSRRRDAAALQRGVPTRGGQMLKSMSERVGTWLDRASDGPGPLASGLGLFSLGLGAAELAAPGSVARFIGVRDDDDNRATLRACGVREIASGLAILTQQKPASALWGRVGGDLMDLFLLGTAASAPETRKDRLAFAAAAVAGVTVLDVVASMQHSADQGLRNGHRNGRSSAQPGRLSVGASAAHTRQPGGKTQRAELEQRGLHVNHAITVNRPVEEVYNFWRDFQNLPRFMHHLESVQKLDERHSRWKVRAPAGTTVEWEAETVTDRPNELIAWRSLPGASVQNAGVVRFKRAPGDRGTEVEVELTYRPPLGAVGAVIAKLFGEAPEQQVKHELKMFKAVLETGEVVHSDASIHRGMHPAQPPKRVLNSQSNQTRGVDR